MTKLEFQQKFNISNEVLNDFSRFCDFLLENNKRFNLTAIRDEEGVFLKHFADSLFGLSHFDNAGRILEVGSGGGFPSVPLKIANRDLDLTLVEATGKKCTFLNSVKQLFGFENFSVINARCEELAKNGYREAFDTVTARAVASLNVLIELCAPFLKVGGKCVFYKNLSESELKEGENALRKTGCEICQILPYSLDGEQASRCLIIVKKTQKTPDIYPREYKQILKKPL